MLVLSRKTSEVIRIGDHIQIMVVGVNTKTGNVRLGITAPKELAVHRQEIYEQIQREGKGDGSNSAEA